MHCRDDYDYWNKEYYTDKADKEHKDADDAERYRDYQSDERRPY